MMAEPLINHNPPDLKSGPTRMKSDPHDLFQGVETRDSLFAQTDLDSLPDINYQHFANAELCINTEPKEKNEFEMLPKTDFVLGQLCIKIEPKEENEFQMLSFDEYIQMPLYGDELLLAETKIELPDLNPDTVIEWQETDILRSSRVFEDMKRTTYSEDSCLQDFIYSYLRGTPTHAQSGLIKHLPELQTAVNEATLIDHKSKNIKPSCNKLQNTKGKRQTDFYSTQQCDSQPRLGDQSKIVLLPCLHCQKNFICFEDLNQHHRSHESIQIKNQCYLCKKVFTEISLLKCHSEICVREIKPENEYCDEILPKCSKYQKLIISQQLEPHPDTVTVDMFKCGYCGKAFILKQALEYRYHILTHTGEEPHKCCWKTSLNTQIMSYTGEKPQKSVDDIHTHTSPHFGKKNYKCSFCGKVFSLKWMLTRHILIHTGKRPHKCSQCGKDFCRKDELNRHMWTHIRKSPHTCSQRENSSRLKGHLKHSEKKTRPKKHANTRSLTLFEENPTVKNDLDLHTLSQFGRKCYKCSFCGKGFALKQVLTRHIFIHTGIRPHRCSQCGKDFYRKDALTRHMWTHIRKKPPTCSHREKSSRHLRTHVLKHLGKKTRPKMNVNTRS